MSSLSLLFPILFHLCCRLTLPCHVYVCLLLPSHHHWVPRCNLCPLTQVQKWLHSNVLRDCDLPLTNLFFHDLKTCLLPCLCRWGVIPLSVWFPPREPPHQKPLHLVLKPPQDPAHTGGDYSCFCAKERYRLKHGFKDQPVKLRRRPLLAEDLRHPLPHCANPCQIP